MEMKQSLSAMLLLCPAISSQYKKRCVRDIIRVSSTFIAWYKVLH